MWMLAVALGAPVDDAVRLFALGRYSCVERRGGDVACWGGKHDRATPIAAIEGIPDEPPCRADGEALVCHDGRWDLPGVPERVAGRCALLQGVVRCVGVGWRWHAGMPPGTPTDRLVEVPAFAGAVDLGLRGAAEPRLCAVVDGAVLCAWNGQVEPWAGLPPIARILSGDCLLAADGAAWCPARDPKPVAPEALDAAGSSSRTVVRLPDGRVQAEAHHGSRKGPVPLADIDVPALQVAGPGTVLVRDDHSCALAPDGRVGCWGSDLKNGLGDGGLSMRLVERAPGYEAPRRDDEPLLPCELDDGVVTCEGTAPWETQWNAEHSAMAPLRIDDVVQLSVGEELGCALKADGDLHCFGWIRDELVLPDPPVLRGIARVDVSVGYSALGKDGRLHRRLYDGGIGAWGPLPDATGLVHGESFSCVVGPSGRLCAHDGGPLRLVGADGPLVRSPGGELCVQGTNRCEEGSWSTETGSATDVVWVEAGW